MCIYGYMFFAGIVDFHSTVRRPIFILRTQMVRVFRSSVICKIVCENENVIKRFKNYVLAFLPKSRNNI